MMGREVTPQGAGRGLYSLGRVERRHHVSQDRTGAARASHRMLNSGRREPDLSLSGSEARRSASSTGFYSSWYGSVRYGRDEEVKGHVISSQLRFKDMD